jgi:hypothetical protein
MSKDQTLASQELSDDELGEMFQPKQPTIVGRKKRAALKGLRQK